MFCHDQFCNGAASDGAATICQYREAFAFIFVLNFHNNPVKYVLSQFAYVEAESQKAGWLLPSCPAIQHQHHLSGPGSPPCPLPFPSLWLFPIAVYYLRPFARHLEDHRGKYCTDIAIFERIRKCCEAE